MSKAGNKFTTCQEAVVSYSLLSHRLNPQHTELVEIGPYVVLPTCKTRSKTKLKLVCDFVFGRCRHRQWRVVVVRGARGQYCHP